MIPILLYNFYTRTLYIRKKINITDLNSHDDTGGEVCDPHCTVSSIDTLACAQKQYTKMS